MAEPTENKEDLLDTSTKEELEREAELRRLAEEEERHIDEEIAKLNAKPSVLPDYRKILGTEKDTKTEVKKRYDEKVAEGGETPELKEAYEILSDREKRTIYDRKSKIVQAVELIIESGGLTDEEKEELHLQLNLKRQMEVLDEKLEIIEQTGKAKSTSSSEIMANKLDECKNFQHDLELLAMQRVGEKKATRPPKRKTVTPKAGRGTDKSDSDKAEDNDADKEPVVEPIEPPKAEEPDDFADALMEDGLRIELAQEEADLEACLNIKRQKLGELDVLENSLLDHEKVLRQWEDYIAKLESYFAYIKAALFGGFDAYGEYVKQQKEAYQKVIDAKRAVEEQVRLKKSEIEKAEQEVLSARRKVLLKVNAVNEKQITVDGEIFTRESLKPSELVNLKEELRQEVVDEQIAGRYEKLSDEEKDEYENTDEYRKAIEEQCKEVNEDLRKFGITITPEVFCKMADEGYDLSDVNVRDSLVLGSIKPIGIATGTGVAFSLVGGIGGFLVGAGLGYAGANADKLEMGAGYALDYTVGLVYDADFVRKMKNAEYTNDATNDFFRKQYSGIVVGGENGKVFSDRQLKKMLDEFQRELNERLDKAVEEKLTEKEQNAITTAIDVAKGRQEEPAVVEAREKEEAEKQEKLKWKKMFSRLVAICKNYINYFKGAKNQEAVDEFEKYMERQQGNIDGGRWGGAKTVEEFEKDSRDYYREKSKEFQQKAREEKAEKEKAKKEPEKKSRPKKSRKRKEF